MRWLSSTVRHPSVCCPSYGHISKSKQDRPIVTAECYQEVGITDSGAVFRFSSRHCPLEIFGFHIGYRICGNINTSSLTWHQITAMVKQTRLECDPGNLLFTIVVCCIDDVKVEQEVDQLFCSATLVCSFNASFLQLCCQNVTLVLNISSFLLVVFCTRLSYSNFSYHNYHRLYIVKVTIQSSFVANLLFQAKQNNHCCKITVKPFCMSIRK